MDCSLPGSSVHGIFQARVLEWGAIAFSLNQVKPLLKVFQWIPVAFGIKSKLIRIFQDLAIVYLFSHHFLQSWSSPTCPTLTHLHSSQNALLPRMIFSFFPISSCSSSKLSSEALFKNAFQISQSSWAYLDQHIYHPLSCFLSVFSLDHESRNRLKWSEVKSHSSVWLFATPWTVAYQAPPSMGFSRQEYWSGVPFPSPGDLSNPGLLHCWQTEPIGYIVLNLNTQQLAHSRCLTNVQ